MSRLSVVVDEARGFVERACDGDRALSDPWLRTVRVRNMQAYAQALDDLRASYARSLDDVARAVTS